MEYKIITLVFLIIACGYVSAGFIFIASKWKLISWYQLNRKLWMPDVCFYCLGFWLSCFMLIGLYYSGFPFDWLYCFTPFASAVIASQK